MPFEYTCDNCGFRIFPRKRFKVEECRICGESINPTYVCRNCGHKLPYDKFSQLSECPKCGEAVPEEKIESKAPEKAMMEGNELTVEIKEGETTTLESVEKVSLNIFGEEIVRIKNPDYAEFPAIKDYERTEDGVDLHFQPEEKEELIKKIKKLKDLK